MKTTKKLLCALCLSSAAFAGESIVIATTPPVVAPVADSAWYAEISAFYGFASKDIVKGYKELGSVDTLGGDFTIGYQLDDNNSINFRMGYGYGSQDCRSIYGNYGEYYEYSDDKIKVHTFTFMPGYRYTTKLDDSWGMFVGANVGISTMNVKAKSTYGEQWVMPGGSSWSDTKKASASEVGFAYSAEIGVQYSFTDDMYAFLAYEFRGSTASPAEKVTTPNGSYTAFEANSQLYHTIRLGVGYQF